MIPKLASLLVVPYIITLGIIAFELEKKCPTNYQFTFAGGECVWHLPDIVMLPNQKLYKTYDRQTGTFTTYPMPVADKDGFATVTIMYL